MSRRHAAKIAVFLGFCLYFGLDKVIFCCNLFTYDVIQHTNRNKLPNKGKESKKIRKNGNGNVFQNLMKTVAVFLENNSRFFFNKAHPEILSHISRFLHKEGLKILK